MKIRVRETLFLSVFLISFTSLLAEILLTRIFSATLMYHFAFFVISVVMFGFSFGGTTLYIIQGRIKKTPPQKVVYSVLLLTSLSFLPLLVVPYISFNPYGIDEINYSALIFLFLLCSLPFFFIGFLLSYLFTIYRKDSGYIYFFDLAGAGLGVFSAYFLINYLGMMSSLILLCVFSSFTVALSSAKKNLLPSLTLVLVFILFIPGIAFLNEDPIAKGRDLSALFTKWNTFSMIRVYGNETAAGLTDRSIYCTTDAYNGTFPQQLSMDIDAGASTPIIRYSGNSSDLEFFRFDAVSVAYHLSNFSSALIIGPGGGRDVLAAIFFGVPSITAVEINPIIVNDVMKGRFRNYSGDIYQHEGVVIVLDDARSYIRNSNKKYGIIQATFVDTWAATSAGAYSLSENNLYTVESVSEYISHLSSDGFLTISRFNGSESLKLTMLYVEAAKKLGIKDPGKHIAVIRYKQHSTHIFKNSEFTQSEIQALLSDAKKTNYETDYYPGSPVKNPFSAIIEDNESARLASSGFFDLSPSTDDSPFFFNNKKISQIPGVLTGENKDVGLFLLYGLLLLSLILTFILIIPVAVIKRKTLKGGSAKYLYLGYFSLLGLAFMIIEVSFLQKFMLFLGHPIYSTLVVLSSLLISAGIGSFITGMVDPKNIKAFLSKALTATILIIVIYNISLYPLFNLLLGLDIQFRVLISILLLSIMGLFMGMLFPLGIKAVGTHDSELIPICWSANGAFSVLGSVLAVIFSMNAGFTNTIFAAAGLYFIAFILSRSKKFWPKESEN